MTPPSDSPRPPSTSHPPQEQPSTSLPADPEQDRRSGVRQVVGGLVLAVVGAVLSLLLVQADSTTAASFGYLVLAAGVVLVGNGLLLRRKAGRTTLRPEQRG